MTRAARHAACASVHVCVARGSGPEAAARRRRARCAWPRGSAAASSDILLTLGNAACRTRSRQASATQARAASETTMAVDAEGDALRGAAPQDGRANLCRYTRRASRGIRGGRPGIRGGRRHQLVQVFEEGPVPVAQPLGGARGRRDQLIIPAKNWGAGNKVRRRRAGGRHGKKAAAGLSTGRASCRTVGACEAWARKSTAAAQGFERACGT